MDGSTDLCEQTIIFLQFILSVLAQRMFWPPVVIKAAFFQI